MKSVILSAALLLSSHAFGFIVDDNKTHTFNGNGVWKTAAGAKGTYSIEMKIQAQESGQATVTESYKFDSGKTMDVSYNLVKGENGFFDVQKADAKVGQGYCFAMKKQKAKACHMESTSAEHNGEHTLHVDLAKKEVHRMGSLDHAGSKIAWADTVKFNSAE